LQLASIDQAISTDCCFQVAVEDRPYPKIQKPTDAVLKVSSTALCGSDLHFYRGHLKCPPDFICGHEFVGEIVEKGDEVSKFNIGDKVRNFGADWE
jgi:threonine dehydrogenase-like Zn-dependent dehydrogenase